MTLKQYLTIMILGSVLCWVSFFTVVFNVDPFTDAGIGFVFFYISLFFSLLGSLSLLVFFVRSLFLKNVPMFRHVKKSFSDAVVISGILLVLLWLQAKSYLNWINFSALLILLVLIISFSKQKNVSINSN